MLFLMWYRSILMNSLIKSKYISTALVSLVLCGSAFASEQNPDGNDPSKKAINPLFSAAMAQTPEFAMEEMGDFIGLLSGILDMTNQTGNLPQDPDAFQAHLAGMTANFESKMGASVARMTQAAEQAAEKELLANPDIKQMHQRLMAAVECNSAEEVLAILDALKTYASKKEMAVTDVINKAAMKAKENNNYPLLECILVKTNSEMGGMYLSSIGTGILVRASRDAELECMRFLLNSKIAFKASDVETVLYYASSQCNLDMIQLAMNYFESKGLKAEMFGLKSFCVQAASHQDKVLAKRAHRYILVNADKQFGVGPFDIDYYFQHLVLLAQEFGEMQLLEALLNRPANDGPSSYDLDNAITSNILRQNVVANLANTPLMNLFFNRTAIQSRPSDYTISAVMRASAQNGCVDFIRSMVDRDATFIRPTNEDLVSAYREAVALNQVAVMAYLRPLIPADDEPAAIYIPGLNPRYDVGGCLGVHNYANAPVKVEGSQHASVKLLDAVWDHLSAKCKLLETQKEYVPLTFDGACADVNDWITSFVPEEEQKTARDAAFHRLISDKDYEDVLTLVVNYLNAYHPEGIEVWITAFIRESITAYNSENSVSCDRGIRERVSVGLRKIDAELDKIFVQVEGPVLMTNTIKKWNPSGEPEKVAALLVGAGISPEAEAEDAAALFRQLFASDVKANGLSMDDYQDVMDVISEGILAYYTNIKAQFKKPVEK
jgi:hypothetical protein